MALHGVDSDFMCCAFVTDEQDMIIEAAPIIGYAKGRSLSWFVAYALRRGWRVYSIPKED